MNTKTPESELSSIIHWLVLSSVSYLAFQGLSFLVCNMGIIVAPTSQSC